MNKIYLILSVSLLLVGTANHVSAQLDDKLAVLETNLGTIVIEFFADDAPGHVDNFINLTESGFYDGVLFHRIIPGFMIQGGDPNTISGDPATWGQGGPETNVDAEFNTIKHNRGIVSMARSVDPNSGGSQFFIVHNASNFLDTQYTVFGRIVTEESFETLDEIASVQTVAGDAPLDPEAVRITKAMIVNRSEIPNTLDLPEPERTEAIPEPPDIPDPVPTESKFTIINNTKLESTEHGITFSVPQGWILQEPEKFEGSPDIVAVGPVTGQLNPYIAFTVFDAGEKTFDEIISEKTDEIEEFTQSGTLQIISQDNVMINGIEGFEINVKDEFPISETETLEIQFKEVLLYNDEKYYSILYANGLDNFDLQLSRFQETLDSFQLLTPPGGGCLIATAAFGTELAPQVQALRELRDNVILQTNSGAAFMSGFNQLYYSFSPGIADLERENPLFREAVKLSITPMLHTLSLLDHAHIDSEHDMIFHGIGIILMNVGMYFLAPAIIIYKIRK